MQAANRFQKALRAGSGLSFGAWQMLPGANISRILARAGYDWVCVDAEHGNIDDGAMHEAVAAIAGCGVSPIVRIPANEGWMVKRALDAGAHGLVVPLLNTPEDARNLVRAAKFPPKGIRGFGSPFAGAAFGISSLTEYLQQANDAIITIVQIETQEALNNVDAIAKVDGVDVLLVGPFDLGNNIGFPILDGTMAPELKKAIADIKHTALENGKKVGIYATSGDQARQFADDGFQMISVMTDVPSLSTHMVESLAKAKGSYAHAALNIAKGVAAKATGSKDP